MKITSSILLLALLLALAPAGAAKEPPKPIDWGVYYTVLPDMKAIAEKSKQSIYDMHTLIGELKKGPGDQKAAEIRAKLRTLLVEHRKLKLDMVGIVDKVLMLPEPKRKDLDTLRIFRNTTLRRVSWNGQFLKYVARDLAEATGLDIRLSNPVQELNTVEINFPEVTAESALNLICQNFGLKWIIFEGEIIVYRALNRNEERFLDYESRHGKVDWIAEDKKSTYETLPADQAKKELHAVEDMDLPLLEGNLTKLYILEGESGLHEVRLKELELASKFGENLKNALGQTDEMKEADVKRQKHVVHYMYMERDNAVEVWHILNQVLGDRLLLADDNAELRQILQKEISAIHWTQKDLEDALFELGRLVDVPVEIDLPPFVEMTINLNVENVTLETVIQLICDIQPLDWKYANGKLFFAHAGK